PTTKTITLNNQQFTQLNLPGSIGFAPNPGEPTLPARFIQLALPPYTSIVNIAITGNANELDLLGIDLHNQPIKPYQPSQPIGMTMPQEIVYDTTIYNSNQLYPLTPFESYELSYSRGYPIISLALHPIQYNPAGGKLFIYNELTVTMELEQTTTLNEMYRGIETDRQWAQSLVWNPEVIDLYRTLDTPTFGYPGGLCDPSEHYDYVIITTTHNGLDYWTTSGTIPYNWESLMDKHQTVNGLQCTLVTIQDIDICTDYHNSNPLFNDQTAHIREFCKDAYQDWETKYVLIAGDDEWIPAREMKTSYEGDIDSDLYWSNLDLTFNADQDNYWGEEGDSGFDLYSEIFIGRLTCDEPQDVSNWMTKSFYYTDHNEMDYLDNAGFYGGNTGWNCEGDDFMDFSAIKGTNDWLGPIPHSDGPWPTWLGFLYGFETFNFKNPGIAYNLSAMWTAEPPNPGWKGGTESQAITGLRDAINDDQVTLLSGIAHADSHMSLDVYDTSWESQYHNTKPFFIHDYGCHCGDMDATDDGVLHSMLFHSDTELAFGCVYNTCYGWGNFDTTNSSSALQTKIFWDYFFDLQNNSISPSNWQLGKGHAWSKDVMAPTINWDHTWRAVIQGCLLFADPAQRIKPPRTNTAPQTPETPTGPLEGPVGIPHSFTTSTTDPDDDPVLFMFEWGDGIYSDWIGPFNSGEIITANHSWFAAGTYAIRVKAKDLYGMLTPWSQPTTIMIGVAEIVIGSTTGGLGKFTIDLSNTGVADAYNLRWSVTCRGGLAKMISQQKSGTEDILSSGDSLTFNPIMGLFGLGRLSIIIDARADYTPV
ncbi:MAG: hypothetical protein KKG04_08095, partial [Candidatus Thermoplasmatota archaeon]|nr:hypothetical protein [Candidatus Thermoplasmatota archaeon]